MLRNPYLLAAACLLSMILVSSLNTMSRAHTTNVAENSDTMLLTTHSGRNIASEELPTPVTLVGKKPAPHATK